MSTPEPTRQLLIRADASIRIGTGHVMRCLALAQGWAQAGGRVTFAMAGSSVPLRFRLEREGFEVITLQVEPGSAEDAVATLQLARDLPASWLIADGYAFASDWQEVVRAGGVRLAVLDDYGHADRYFADLILNQNVLVDPQLYVRREATSRLALGPGYALLRREFLAWSGAARLIPAIATKVLVTLGGSDPDNVTARVLANLRGLSGIEVIVVVGGSNPHRVALEALVQECNAGTPWLRLEVDATNMPELMAWAEVAVSAGGSTLWELAYMGLPALLLVLAENQVPAARALDAAGIAQLLASPDDLTGALAALLPDAARRRAMSAAARLLVDGRGVARVLGQLEAA